ncbi:hypothetical protein [Azospirillum sp. sgz301742]
MVILKPALLFFIIPAKAGIQPTQVRHLKAWIPACAGMTVERRDGGPATRVGQIFDPVQDMEFGRITGKRQ